jgi:aryl carrier-like protein
MLLDSLGQLYGLGVDIDWQGVDPNARRISLPTYAFDRQRYWITDDLTKSEKKEPEFVQRQRKLTPTQYPSLLEYLQESVAQVLGLNPAALDINKPLMDLGLDSLMVVELNNRVRTELGLKLEIPSTSIIESLTITRLVDHLRKQGVTISPVTSNYQEMTPVHQEMTPALATQLIECLEHLSQREVDSWLAHLLSQ